MELIGSDRMDMDSVFNELNEEQEDEVFGNIKCA